MLPAEVQRIILLIGLAITAYLMMLAWNEDYGQSAVAENYNVAPQSENYKQQASNPIIGSYQPEQADNSIIPVEILNDLPDESMIAPNKEYSQNGADKTSVGRLDSIQVSDRLIHVSTDVLDVWIDRLGGDIVRTQLPQYPVTLENPELAYILLDNDDNFTYVAQSGLFGRDGIDRTSSQRPLYISDSDEYELVNKENLVVELVTERSGVIVTKSFKFSPDSYVIDIRYTIENSSGSPFRASLFAQIKRDSSEPKSGASSFVLGPKPYLGPALTTSESRYEKLPFDDIEEEEFQEDIRGGWIAMLEHYFLSAWIADPNENNRYYGKKRGELYIVGYSGPLMEIADGDTGEFKARFYSGPKIQSRLSQISENLNLTVDYGFLWWIAVPLFKLLLWLEGFAGNWGIAIILLTFLVKLLLYPLSAAGFRSMGKLRKVAPKMKKIQEKYKDDRQKLSQEMMGFYKKEGVNPMGGCLPMLLPMPIFLALYWVLFESVELRQAPFLLWIHDLAIMDPYFVLPLLMGASMWFMQSLNPPPADPMQAKMMKIMPVMFTAMFLFFPSGLVLYWLVNNVLGIGQQWYINRQIDNAG
ncbi:MAG: membrane protein insertase YidC [Pseudomonadales bacterium]|nr:membrane protein insertase YidC [Pseudomonadales bacterium]